MPPRARLSAAAWVKNHADSRPPNRVASVATSHARPHQPTGTLPGAGTSAGKSPAPPPVAPPAARAPRAAHLQPRSPQVLLRPPEPPHQAAIPAAAPTTRTGIEQYSARRTPPRRCRRRRTGAATSGRGSASCSAGRASRPRVMGASSRLGPLDPERPGGLVLASAATTGPPRPTGGPRRRPPGWRRSSTSASARPPTTPACRRPTDCRGRRAAPPAPRHVGEGQQHPQAEHGPADVDHQVERVPPQPALVGVDAPRHPQQPEDAWGRR